MHTVSQAQQQVRLIVLLGVLIQAIVHVALPLGKASHVLRLIQQITIEENTC